MENRSLDNIIKSSLENFEVEPTPQDWAFMEDMLNAEEVEPIDETAQAKLQNIEVPFDATTWLAMENALENLEIEAIDEAVKSALEAFETPYHPDDWSAMEQKIDAELPNAIDEMAKSALSEYTVPFAPLDWAMMDAQLDDAGFPHEVDEAVKAALEEYESTQAANWAAMENTLVEVENVRRQLILTKSIEIVLFVFAIWTIGNFLPFNHKSSDAVNSSTEIIEQKPDAILIPQANNTSESNLTESSELSMISINGATVNNIQQNRAETVINSLESEEIRGNTTTNNTTAEGVNTPLWMENYVEKIIEEAKAIKTKNTNSTDENVLTAKPLATISAEDLVTYGEDKKGPTFTIKKKKELTNTLVVASFIDTKTPELVLETPERLISSVNTQYVTSPFHIKASVSTQHANFIENGKSQSPKGLATNLGIDYAISDKIEFSTGVAYNNKSYAYSNLEPFVNTSSPKVVAVNRVVNLDILQVPLRLNFNFRKDKKTRLYAIVGITPGLIIKEDTKKSNASLINNVTPGTYKTILDDNANDAMFASVESGSSSSSKISARTFAMADLGLGLEYKTNTRFNFFIEPLFQRSLDGIGSNDEMYKNYSLALGSRVTL